MKTLIVALFICLCQQDLISGVLGDENTDKLMKNLLQDYVKIVYPGNITLDVALALSDLEFNPKNDVLTVTAWEYYTWKDERLAWDPEQYAGLKTIRIPDTHLWLPDMMLFNLYGGSYSRTPVNTVLRNTGEITWIPPSVFQVRCSRNEDSDKQSEDDDDDALTCKIKLGSWTYDGFSIRLSNSAQAIDLSILWPNNKLQLLSAEPKINTLTYECCTEPYMDYTVILKIKPSE